MAQPVQSGEPMHVAPRSPRHLAIGRSIKARRAELGISQEELARRSGLGRSYVSSSERGELNFSAANLFKIADALEIPLSQLLERAERLLETS